MKTFKFRARFRKVSTGQEIWQFAALGRNNITDPIKDMPGGYLQITDWEQHIGIDDIKGLEIYEGHIIETPGFTGVVCKDPFETRFAIQPINESCLLAICHDENNTFLEGKIVGNIHENPELLNEK